MNRARELIKRHPRDIVAVAGIAFAVFVLTLHWAPRSIWTPDALFYQSKVLEFRGASQEEALAEVWSGPLSAGFRAADARRPPGTRALDDPEWLDHSARGFERRLVVPALAAAVYPLAGDDSLELVSIVGALAFALLLYALLRLRFGPLPSVVAVALCLAWPPVRFAFQPLTESWGLALVVLALLAGVLFAERGGRWLWVWVAAILTLGLTRDLTPVPIVAALTLLIVSPGPRQWQLVIGGVLAALPGPLIGGAALRESLAYTFSGNRIPEDSSWGYVSDHYFGAVGDAIRTNFETLFESRPRYFEEAWPLLPFAMVLLAGLVLLVATRAPSRGDPFLVLAKGSIIGAVVYFALLPTYSFYRRELALLPAAAVGIAIGADLLSRWVGTRARLADESAGHLGS